MTATIKVQCPYCGALIALHQHHCDQCAGEVNYVHVYPPLLVSQQSGRETGSIGTNAGGETDAVTDQQGEDALSTAAASHSLREHLQSEESQALTYEVERQPILVCKPSWANFILHLLFFFLVFPVVIAILRRYSLSVKLFEDTIEISRGIGKLSAEHISLDSISSISLYRNALQRIVKTGDIHLELTNGKVIKLQGLNRPESLRRLILGQKQAILFGQL